MDFDLAALRREMDAAPPAAELPSEVAVAVVSDTFRLAGIAPPEARSWERWRKRWPRAGEMLAALARALVTTSLREQSVGVLQAARPDPRKALEGFMERTAPLTAEMVRSNAFRQEEFLRHWIAACGGRVHGETEAQSRQRLEQLDYRQALEEYRKADAVRKAEAARRAQLLREAREREEQAKGWRE